MKQNTRSLVELAGVFVLIGGGSAAIQNRER